MVFFDFCRKLIREVIKDDVISLSNELSYKFIMALFPFIIFMVSVLGFLNIDKNLLLMKLSDALPPDAYDLIYVFVDEVIDTRHISLLSTSLLISLISSSSGVRAVIRGINKAYGQKETRNFVVIWGISILLVFVFATAIILSMVFIIFEDALKVLLHQYFNFSLVGLKYFGVVGFLVAVCLLLAMTIVINQLSNSRRVTFASVLPGSAASVVLWIAASKIFNIYINRFSNYSKVYGSIGSVFILLLWLNMIAASLLIGSEMNALLESDDNRM